MEYQDNQDVLEPASQWSPPSSDVAAVRHWFVQSAEGSYIGPVDAAELERLWNESEVDEDTLLWAEGMPDWQRLGDMPELMYLAATHVPHVSVTPIEWRATECADLSALVEAELRALDDEPEEAAPTLAPPIAGLPSLRPDADPFAQWWAGSTAAGTEALPFVAPTPWAPRARRVPRWPFVAVAALIVLAGSFTLASYELTGTEASLSPSAVPALVAPASVADEDASVPAVPALAEASRLGPPPAPAPADAAPAVPAVPASAKSPRAEPAAETAPPREPAAAATSAAKREDEDTAEDADEDEDADVSEDDEEERGLSPQEVVEAVRPQASSLAPCIKEAREQGLLEAQKYTFVLDWRIRRDGSVAGVKLKAPEAVASAPISACFAAAMSRWHFRPSPSEVPVRNFPIPVTVR